MKYICAFYPTWHFNLWMLSHSLYAVLVYGIFIFVQMSLHFRWLLYKSKESSSCSIQFARFYWIKCSILWLNTRENSMKNVVVVVFCIRFIYKMRIAVVFTYIWHHSSGSRKCIRSVLILVYLYSHCCCGVRRRHQIHVMHKTEIIYTLRKWQMRASEREKHAPSTCSQRAFYGIWKPCVWHKLCVTVHWQICCHLNFFFAHLLNIT